MKKGSIERISWQKARTYLATVNPLLARCIDEASPSEHCPLYLAKYPYGAPIAFHGVFYVPARDGKIVPMTHSEVDHQIKNDFRYTQAASPMGILLRKTLEESLENIEGNFVPGTIVSPGSLICPWDRFHCLTAGARCIFLLPNIRDRELHRKLKQNFRLRLTPPKNLFDHWEIFKSIAAHPHIACDWEAEVLLFSESWIRQLKNHPTWKSFYLFLYQHDYERSSYKRNQPTYDLALSKALANRNLKPNPYIVSTLKYLFMIATGTFAGFGVATDDTHAPVSLIQKIYLEHYGLKKYIPTIFQPTLFSLSMPGPPVYYSLNLPTNLESLPKSRRASSTFNDLSELKHVLMIFLDEVRKNNLRLAGTIIEKIAQEVDFNFFHYKSDNEGDIKLSSEMIQHDPRLIYCLADCRNQAFAEAGLFLRGCVQISHKSIQPNPIPNKTDVNSKK